MEEYDPYAPYEPLSDEFADMNSLEGEIVMLIHAGYDDNYITGLLGCDYDIVREIRGDIPEDDEEIETRYGSLLPYGGGGPGVNWEDV